MSKKTAKTSKPAKSKPSAKAKTREQQNGVTCPGAGTLCAKVWEALDRLQKAGKETTATTALEVLKNEKMADATVRTQTQRWREFHGIRREEKKRTGNSKAAIAKQAAAPAEVPPTA
jgi:hypothetical protein